jgi:hypothetical protein
MPIRRVTIFPTTLLALSLAACAAVTVTRSAHAANEDMLPPEEMGPAEKSEDVGAAAAAKKASTSGRYGDVSLTIVESFGKINMPNDSERGASGAMQGSGWDLRYMMVPGVGAYMRWESLGQTSNVPASAPTSWYLLQYVFGFAGRLHSTGRPGLWSIRTSSRIQWGIMYFQAGTNTDGCTHGWLPLSTSCGGAPTTLNASGAGWGTELRLAGEIDFGPLALALDVGAMGYRRWSTGSSSVSIPGWFWMPTAQLKFGLALPFD